MEKKECQTRLHDLSTPVIRQMRMSGFYKSGISFLSPSFKIDLFRAQYPLLAHPFIKNKKINNFISIFKGSTYYNIV